MDHHYGFSVDLSCFTGWWKYDQLQNMRFSLWASFLWVVELLAWRSPRSGQLSVRSSWFLVGVGGLHFYGLKFFQDIWVILGSGYVDIWYKSAYNVYHNVLSSCTTMIQMMIQHPNISPWRTIVFISFPPRPTWIHRPPSRPWKRVAMKPGWLPCGRVTRLGGGGCWS